MLPGIYILLPIHNRLEATKRFVESLLAQTYKNYHLVLIDDGSTDGTQDYVKSKVKKLIVITGRGDWWWGGGLHQGYLWFKQNNVSADDLVLMINNDTEFVPDFFQTAVDLMASNQKTLLLARAYSYKDGKLIESGVHVDWKRLTFKQAIKPDEINCLPTRGLFLRAGDLMNIGGFHPVILPHYLSDYEFTIRAYRKGYRLITDLSLKLTVDESVTGYHECDDSWSWPDFLKRYFSRRSADHRLSWFSFVALACPWSWKIVNILRVIYALVTRFVRSIGGGRKQCFDWRR